MALSVSTRRTSGALTVVAVGEVDLDTVEALRTAIVAAVEAGDGSAVLVDLSGVTFLDSAGISALLRGRQLADDTATEYRVDGAQGVVREVLELTGVWRHLAGSAS